MLRWARGSCLLPVSVSRLATRRAASWLRCWLLARRKRASDQTASSKRERSAARSGLVPLPGLLTAMSTLSLIPRASLLSSELLN